MREEKSKSGKVKMRNKALFIGMIGIVAIALAVAAIGATANNNTEASDKVNVPDVPHKINYQGYLTDTDGNQITGDRDMTFGIYDSNTGGTPLWSETQTSVHVEKGLFNVILGSVNPIPGDVFPSGGSRWLETEISGQPLTPRKEIVSVAYAFKANQDDDWDDAGTGMMYTHYLGDNVGIGVKNPAHHLEVRGGAASGPWGFVVEANNLADFTGAMLEFNGVNRDGLVNIFAGTWDDPYIEGGRPVIKLHPSTQGNNRVILMVDDYDFQKFKIRTQGIYGDTMEERMRDTGGKDVLTITQDGNVGIGTTDPGSGFNTKFDVVGSSSFRTNSGDTTKALMVDTIGSRHRIYTDAISGTAYDLILGTYPNGHMNQLVLQQSTGNVGIGTTEPHSTLHITGSLAKAFRSLGPSASSVALTASDCIIAADAPLDIRLPTAVGIAGRVYTIKRIDAGCFIVEIQPVDGQMIDGQTSYSLVSQWSYVTIVSDGANWLIIAEGR